MKLRLTTLARVLVPCLLIALPAVSMAGSPRYLYGHFGYTTTDGLGDGYNFQVSAPVAPNVHVMASWMSFSDGLSPVETTNDAYSVGVGYNYALKPNLDLVARVGYAHTKENEKSSSFDINTHQSSYYLHGLTRWMATDKLEIDAGVLRNNGFGPDRDTTYITTAVYYDIIPGLAVGVDAWLKASGSSTSSNYLSAESIYSINVRYYPPIRGLSDSMNKGSSSGSY